jgi:hypothetical protein
MARTSSLSNQDPIIPKNKYHLINSSTAPAPPSAQSWQHYHAPFSQNFGYYVCLKRSTLRDLGGFLRDALVSDVDGIPLDSLR